MNKVDVLTPRDFAQAEPIARAERRSAPKAIKVVLPVWGYNYVRQFLEIGLRTLLAPGNIPALATTLPTEFVLLTSEDDRALIEENAAFKNLAAICDTKIQPIDHLITDGNYSTTITLAYTEAVRAADQTMLDTCFFFLVSDYIIADGSLANALNLMLDGASAVVVGNFQVSYEDALPWLQDRLARNKQPLAIAPRELMRWALTHLHPATLANTVNIPFNHNSHTNRLFWRVDSNTMLGKFYLMHMLCVRPEVTNFIIGSSCDYSFVPEMCPSGNVNAITDSDEYLVIEMQPRHHESRFLQPGPLKESSLAKSLSEWATAVHRANAAHTVIFHADEVPANIDGSIASADAFISKISRYLTRIPQPHRGHPYWYGAMAAFYDATGRKLNEDEWRYVLGLPASTRDWLSTWLLYRAKYALLGRPPHVLPWHPLWPDYQAALAELKPFFDDPKTRLLMLSNEPTALSLILADGGERVQRLRCNPFLQSRAERYTSLHEKFDICLVELPETEMRHGDKLVDKIIPLMKSAGRIIVFVMNRHIHDKPKEFVNSVMYHSARFIRSGAIPTEICFVPANRARWRARRGMFGLRVLIDKNPLFSPVAIVGGAFYLALGSIGNLDSLRRMRRVAPRGHTSSFIMRLTVDVPISARDQAGSGTERSVHRQGPKPAYLHDTGASESSIRSYNRGTEVVDVVSLGQTTSPLWHDRPRHLAIILARYQFVASMIAGRTNVAQVDVDDAFGARLLSTGVVDLTIYNPDPSLIDHIRERQDVGRPMKAEYHDIVLDRLPRVHDVVFSFGLLEQITAEEEHALLLHLSSSLAEDGILIIGASASKEIDSPAFRPSPRNSKSGRELKAILEQCFAQVFIFSMHGERIDPGISPTADYSLAVCTSSKWDVGKPKRQSSPLFEICECARGGYYVRITHPNTEPERVDGFTTITDAARWIAQQASDWLRSDRSTSY
jgi:hypothetical protein